MMIVETPRPPMSTMQEVENGPKALTFCKGGKITQLASSMMPSLMTNTQWLWVAAMTMNNIYHQWRSSNQDPQSGPKGHLCQFHYLGIKSSTGTTTWLC